MRIAVVGAGMVGLTVALRAARDGHTVTVLERESVPGGLASCFLPFADGAPLERFYHHIFRSDAKMIALLEDLGLAPKLVWRAPSTACFHAGRFHRLDSAGSLLRFAPLPKRDRLRLAFALSLLKLVPDGTIFERTHAASWLRSVAGSRAYEIVFEPLFRAKFGRHAERISLGWFWARIHDRTTELGYLAGGFAQVYERLAARVTAAGGTIRYGTSVTALERDDAADRVILTSDDAASRSFDRVVVTLPSKALAAIAPACARADAPDALGARCIVLALDRRLTEQYWINACEPGFPFMVVVEQTNFVSPADYGGRHVVYLGNYGEAFETSPLPERLDAIATTLRAFNPGFERSWIVDAWEFRANGAQPVVTTSYRRTIPGFETCMPGVYLANLEQVYPHDRGQNYAIDVAERAFRACVDPALARGSTVATSGAFPGPDRPLSATG